MLRVSIHVKITAFHIKPKTRPSQKSLNIIIEIDFQYYDIHIYWELAVIIIVFDKTITLGTLNVVHKTKSNW